MAQRLYKVLQGFLQEIRLVDDACTLTLALNTDDGAYWGSGYDVASTVNTQTIPWNERTHSAEITLPPLATVFYVANVD